MNDIFNDAAGDCIIDTQTATWTGPVMVVRYG